MLSGMAFQVELNDSFTKVKLNLNWTDQIEHAGIYVPKYTMLRVM